MAAAFEFYDMVELDEHEGLYLPGAQYHYDMAELGGDVWMATLMEPLWPEEPPLAPDVLKDGSVWLYIQADLLQIATALLAFFGEPAARIANVKHHKIHAIFSAACGVKVQLYGTLLAGMYLLEITDLGTNPYIFNDMVMQATEFLMCCLWETFWQL